MKKILAFILTAFLLGCGPSSNNIQEVTDPRPKGELILIDALVKADSVYDAQANDIGKSDAADTGKKQISNLIMNTLQSKADNWPAIVDRIDVLEWPTKYISVKLLVHMEKNYDNALSNSRAITLISIVNDEDLKIKDALKTLQSADKVMVSGTFDMNADGSPYNIDTDHRRAFDSPIFNFTISAITKDTTKN
ncbi:MAG: hypothetical protein V4619_00335 [Bacteroidota bacterium]